MEIMKDIQNRTLFREDNLKVLRNIESEAIDLIYLDPPYNKNKKFSTDIGQFSDTFKEPRPYEVEAVYKSGYTKLINYMKCIQLNDERYIFNYLVFMSVRLIEMHRVLKLTGSLWLQCDPKSSHYIKLMLDYIFGINNFKHEVIWRRKRGGGKGSESSMSNSHDVLLYYTKSQKYTFNQQYSPLTEEYIRDHYIYTDDDNGKVRYRQHELGKNNTFCPHQLEASIGLHGSGQHYEFKGYTAKYGWLMSKEKMQNLDSQNKILYPKREGETLRRRTDETDTDGVPLTIANIFSAERLTANSGLHSGGQFYEFNGYTAKYGWLMSKEKMQKLDAENKIIYPKNKNGTLRRKIYLKDSQGLPLNTIWYDINNVQVSKERVGYPTEKPLPLMSQIIKTCSNVGDIVLDPFAGSGTTCLAAEQLNRKWVGIEVSESAHTIAVNRLNKDKTLDLVDWQKEIQTAEEKNEIKK